MRPHALKLCVAALLWMTANSVAAEPAKRSAPWKLDGPYPNVEKFCKVRLHADSRLPDKTPEPADRTVCPSGPGPIAAIDSSETWVGAVRDVRPTFVHHERALGPPLDCLHLSLRTSRGWFVQREGVCRGVTAPCCGTDALALERLESGGAGLVVMRYSDRTWVTGSDSAAAMMPTSATDGGAPAGDARVDSTTRVTHQWLVACDASQATPTCLGPIPFGYSLPSGKTYALEVQVISREVRISGAEVERAAFEQAFSTPPTTWTWASVVGTHALGAPRGKPSRSKK